MGLRDEILAMRSNERIVDTPAGAVLVRGITLALKDAVQRAAVDGKPWRGLMVAHCCLDPDTRLRLFRDEDIAALHDLPAHMECVIDAALELSAFADAEIEELEGNSERTPAASIASA